MYCKVFISGSWGERAASSRRRFRHCFLGGQSPFSSAPKAVRMVDCAVAIRCSLSRKTHLWGCAFRPLRGCEGCDIRSQQCLLWMAPFRCHFFLFSSMWCQNTAVLAPLFLDLLFLDFDPTPTTRQFVGAVIK